MEGVIKEIEEIAEENRRAVLSLGVRVCWHWVRSFDLGLTRNSC